MRLEQLAAEYGDQVTVGWRSFLLRPEPEPGGRDLAAFTEYTRKWEQPATLEPAAGFGFPWQGANPPPSHSMPSAIAGRVAATFGDEAGSSFRMRLFEAYFGQHRTISRRSVLREVAAEAGIDPDDFEAAWNAHEDDIIPEVLADHTTAVQSGITGVPAVVLNRRYLVPGAVAVDEYRQAVDQLLSSPAGWFPDDPAGD